MNGSSETQLNWQGAHHLALVTLDLGATVRFPSQDLADGQVASTRAHTLLGAAV